MTRLHMLEAPGDYSEILLCHYLSSDETMNCPFADCGAAFADCLLLPICYFSMFNKAT